MIGLGSMIGAGVFAAIGPAARAAGNGLLIGLAIAGAIAFCNAVSSAQLAALYPESGGTYVYGRVRLGRFWGFLAGWGFVIGKLASCAAMAMTFGMYAAPSLARPLAVSAVFGLTMVNLLGIQKTAAVTRVIVVLVLLSLAAVVAANLMGGSTDIDRLWPVVGASPYGVLQAAGMLFFAFAGYARLATLGEEVIDPRRTIPRAIPLALGITLLIYATVAVSAMLTLDAQALADAGAPLEAAVRAGSLSWLSPAVRVGATIASLGVLLSLILGVSRTAFAMAKNGDLPRALAAVHPRVKVPHRAEAAVGAIVAAAVLVADLRTAIGFSSFAVLLYYAIANACALTLSAAERRWPRAISAIGLAGCVAVAFSLPARSVIGGLVLFAVGVAAYFVRHRIMKSPTAT
ncbi:MAG: amino acid permease [Myxococcales bacterium]|nr:amino acid permease [Myxococcales bacterium]